MCRDEAKEAFSTRREVNREGLLKNKKCQEKGGASKTNRRGLKSKVSINREIGG